jgi:hypothetical protein
MLTLFPLNLQGLLLIFYLSEEQGEKLSKRVDFAKKMISEVLLSRYDDDEAVLFMRITNCKNEIVLPTTYRTIFNGCV